MTKIFNEQSWFFKVKDNEGNYRAAQLDNFGARFAESAFVGSVVTASALAALTIMHGVNKLVGHLSKDK